MQASTELRNIIAGWFESVAKGDLSWADRHISRRDGVRLVGANPSELLKGEKVAEFLKEEMKAMGDVVKVSLGEVEAYQNRRCFKLPLRTSRSRALLSLLLLVWHTSACTTPTQSTSLSPATPADLSSSPAPTLPGAARTAEISELGNDVEARPKSEAGYEAATEGDQIQTGGSVRTGDDSRVRIDTSEGSIIRIASNTEFQLLDFSPQVTDPITKIGLAAGKLWIWVTKALGNGSLDIETPTGVATVRGSLMSVEYQPATGRMIVTCLEGRCRLTAITGQVVDLRAGEFSEIPESGQPPTPVLRMSTLQLAEWADNFPEVSNVIATVTALPPPSPTPRPTGTPTASASTTPTPSSTSPAANCNLHSGDGAQEATITFVNQSSRAVRVYWLNYEGQEVFYFQLTPGQSHSQGTYTTHPWCVRDASSGDAVLAITATEKTQTAVIP